MLLNIGVLKEMAAITDEVTISGGVFQSKAIAQLTADILGVTCYLSPANEPIFGLYDHLSSRCEASQPDSRGDPRFFWLFHMLKPRTLLVDFGSKCLYEVLH